MISPMSRLASFVARFFRRRLASKNTKSKFRLKLALLITYFRSVHQKTKPCPICGEMFRRSINVEAHLVHAHGQERKYPCPHCPQRFIQHRFYNLFFPVFNIFRHRKRHIDQFHSEGGKTLQRMPQRGPNRTLHPSNFGQSDSPPVVPPLHLGQLEHTATLLALQQHTTTHSMFHHFQ